MSGIYIHIPFCRSKCAYCSFFSVISEKQQDDTIQSIKKEIELQKDFLQNEPVGTIYFGGGTPSMIKTKQIFSILDFIYNHFPVVANPEITIEINPDDALSDYLHALSGKFNRLSIGIQSFIEDDLVLLGRKHDVNQARKALETARNAGFDNISIDLIYGISGNDGHWEKNLETAISFAPEHISAYALTVEENTILQNRIRHGKQQPTDENIIENQYYKLIEKLSKAGYEHYEISNFSKLGFDSKHNSNYWNGKKYLGVGPSAHSFNGYERRWNISKIKDYCQGIMLANPIFNSEVLSEVDQYNEFIMLNLRQKKGIAVSTLSELFGQNAINYFKQKTTPFVSSGQIIQSGDRFHLSEKTCLISDYIIAELFI